MTESPAEKSAEKRQMQLAALEHDMKLATPLKEIVWREIQRGTNLDYLAMRYGHYGYTRDRLENARIEHERRELARKAAGGRK